MIMTVFSALTVSSLALADNNAGVWAKLDVKSEIVKVDQDKALKLRLTPEFAFLDDAGGLKQTVVRGGPNMNVAPWLHLTLNGVSNTVNSKHDVRVEVQPELKAKVKNLSLNDRNRLAVRAMDNAEHDRWQYANELKGVYSVTSDYGVFAAYEGYLDVSRWKGNQHRVLGGLEFAMNKTWTADVGYMFRTSVAGPVWVNDNFLFLQLFNK